MTKNELCLTSLVAAIPGAILAVLMIFAFINYAGGPTLGFRLISGLLLLIGAFLGLMPVGIFLRGGPQAAKPKKKDVVPTPEETQASKASDEPVSDEEATFEVGETPGDSEAFAETIDEDESEIAGSSDFDLGAEFDEEEKK